MTLPWYRSVPADWPLDQGDLVSDCPVIGWRDSPVELGEGGEVVGVLRDAIELAQVDVVVMTQTCDLAQRKVNYVVLRPHYPLDVYRATWDAEQRVRGQNPSDKAWGKFLDSVVAGQIWNLAMLNSEDGEGYEAHLRMVDFHEIFSLPRSFLESWLVKEGRARVRLCPPYREHLSQAFARFFMRVGLPADIERMW